ncbi:MAG: PAS domain-containing protein [Saprospiraceae bacterium]|nr:PAS domain-containing protein [Saprospiraceae bacterium]
MISNTTAEHLTPVISLWKKENPVSPHNPFPGLNAADLVASIFSPGPFYYYIFNFSEYHFEYVHPTIEQVIGYRPEEFNLDLMFSIMHPDDVALMQQKEGAAAEFLFKRIPVEKIPYYKVSYTFRFRCRDGNYRNILHQVVTIAQTEDGKIQHVLGVHSDITYLNVPVDDRISFIGLHGEPSFFSLQTAPEYLLLPASKIQLTARERDVVKLLSEGLASKQIAGSLSISVHTVDTIRRKLLRKTGAKNTLELTVACVRDGLF